LTAKMNAAVAETHCATVFFAGDRAYKVKKSLDLGFVDFSTPEHRRAACNREVELNRRFAPDVYLGVAEVSTPDDGPCEWIVVMRRMPADRRLSTLIASVVDVSGELRLVARQLAVHHSTARRSPRIDHAGSQAALRTRWRDNLTALDAFGGRLLDVGTLDRITTLALSYVDGRGPLLRSRIEAGMIRDGHGDLLADDIFGLPDGPRILDCLEFDDDLRAVDGLDDAACLAMDLERLGDAELGMRFMEWFTEFSGEVPVDSLIHHYMAYRATMRAKVHCLRWVQGDVASAATACRLLDIALRHLLAGEPVMVLVGGGPGTGKSTVAGHLADARGAVLLRSDHLRKERAGIAPVTPAAAAWQSGLYAPESTRGTYADLVERGAAILQRGESVVLDATWADAGMRDRARDAADSTHSRLVELRCTAPIDVATTRILARTGTGNPADADPAIAARITADFDEWPEAIDVPTDVPLRDSLDRSVAAAGGPAKALGTFAPDRGVATGRG
jgi:aminoglycoside phosphotransferase family enzyme/predicted kinase